MNLIKGKTSCNRTACQAELVDGAIYYNDSTKANYCPKCAYLINKHNPNLCKLVKSEILHPDKHSKVVADLKTTLEDMHPKDGLSSPRDILLVEDITRLAATINEIDRN